MMHINSIEAYVSEFGNISKRAKLIYNHLRSNSDICYSDRDVMIALGFDEPNQVRPRITELVKSGLIKEVGKRKCETTGKNVRLIKAS